MDMTPAEWQHLLKRLRDNDPTLTSLSLQKINNTDAEELSLALKDNNTLRKLSLFGEKIYVPLGVPISSSEKIEMVRTGKMIDYQGAEALAKMLRHNRGLQEFFIISCYIHNRGIEALKQVFEHNTTLTQMALRENLDPLTDRDIEKDFKRLTDRNRKMSSQNQSKDSTATTTASSTSSDTAKTTTTNAPSTPVANEISNQSDLMLNQLIDRVNNNDPSLTKLVPFFYPLDTNSKRKLAMALKNNRTLTSLNFPGLGDEGLKALREAIEDNHTLIELELGTIQDRDLRAFFVNLLDRNRGLLKQLHAAVITNEFSQVKSLVQHGVSLLLATGVDVGTHAIALGNTPLHWAVIKGQAEIARYLIQVMSERALPLNLRNKNGKTAEQLAAGTPLASLFTMPSAAESSVETQKPSSPANPANTALPTAQPAAPAPAQATSSNSSKDQAQNASPPMPKENALKVFYGEFIGVDDQVEQISRFFTTMKKNPEQKQRFLLLSGPPGTGKTELAKKVSKECGFDFREFVRGDKNDQYVGQLEARVTDFFKNAKKENKYICLSMDEIDAICPESEGAAQAGHHNQDQIVSTIQIQINELVGSKVVLLGATNYLQKLKPAIKSRAGTPVVFKLPTLKIRVAIINNFLDTIKSKDRLELEDAAITSRLAEATTSWSPRQITLYLETVKNKAEQSIEKGRTSNKILTADFVNTFENAREIFKQDYKKECPNTTIEPPSLLLQDKEDIFAELVGLEDNVKLLLQGICEFVKDPAFFRSKGTDVNRNAIFWGPPGTGKTERARLIAQNTNALFINIDAGKYKSPGEQKELKQIFNLAKSFEKAVIFIDEMDAITHEGSWARELLQIELDGFIKGKDNVLVVIGATNYLDHIAAPVKSRFAAKIEVALPTQEARAKLFSLYLGKIQNILFAGILKDNVAAACQELAEVSEGLAPRDIKLLIDMVVTRLADIEKIKKIKEPLTIEDIKKAIASKRRDLGLEEVQKNNQASASSSTSSSTTFYISAKALKYDMKDKLGTGNYGIVYKGSWNNQTVAIKNLLVDDNPAEAKRELQHEASIMAGLQHQNIVKFLGVCTESERFMLVMEYVQKGSLDNVLRSNETLDWPVRIQIAVGTGSGLEYLHRKSILHRDLTSMNVLVTENYDAKLTDFGLAKLKLAISQSAKSNDKGAGTLLWMAPELFLPDGKHSFKSDVYSYGVVMWQLTTRKKPFMNAASPHIATTWVTQGVREKIPENTPPQLASLIGKCWDQRAEARPTAAEVVQELRTLTNK